MAEVHLQPSLTPAQDAYRLANGQVRARMAAIMTERTHGAMEWRISLASIEAATMAVAKEREACLAIILDYQVPVGNSAAGEMACDWTMDALKSIRDAIRARSDKP